MSQTPRFQETLRRLAMSDEGFVEHEAGLGLHPTRASALDPRTATLLQVAVPVALGSPGVCLEWSAGRTLAAGATEDEIADVLLAIAPVAGSPSPLQMWRPRSDMIRRPRWKNRAVNEGSSARVGIADVPEPGGTGDTSQPGRSAAVSPGPGPVDDQGTDPHRDTKRGCLRRSDPAHLPSAGAHGLGMVADGARDFSCGRGHWLDSAQARPSFRRDPS